MPAAKPCSLREIEADDTRLHKVSPFGFPEKLLRFRMDRGLSQQDLADRLGVGKVTVLRWENGTWYRKWFRDDVLLELVAIDREIAAERDTECRDVARVAFSDILRKCSNAHQGYPNVMFDKKRGMAPLPRPEFTRRLGEVSRSVGELDSALAGAPVSDVVLGKGGEHGAGGLQCRCGNHAPSLYWQRAVCRVRLAQPGLAGPRSEEAR